MAVIDEFIILEIKFHNVPRRTITVSLLTLYNLFTQLFIYTTALHNAIPQINQYPVAKKLF